MPCLPPFGIVRRLARRRALPVSKEGNPSIPSFMPPKAGCVARTMERAPVTKCLRQEVDPGRLHVHNNAFPCSTWDLHVPAVVNLTRSEDNARRIGPRPEPRVDTVSSCVENIVNNMLMIMHWLPHPPYEEDGDDGAAAHERRERQLVPHGALGAGRAHGRAATPQVAPAAGAAAARAPPRACALVAPVPRVALCSAGAVFHREIETLAKFLYRLCAREHVPFWVMFGNLLFVLRGQDRIPVGDTDSDVAVQKRVFIDTFQTIDNFTEIVQRDAYLELQRVAFVNYIPERELVQIYLDEHMSGSHADIWLYKEERDSVSGERWLVNEDRTIRAKRFPYEQVLPLADEPAWFLGTPVGMPQNATFLARAEYGSSFMTPMVTRMECIENVINGYAFYHENGNKRRFFALVAVASGAIALILANAVPALKQVLVSPRKMGRPWLEKAREKDFV